MKFVNYSIPIIFSLSFFPSLAFSSGKTSDPLLTYLLIDKAEAHYGEGDPSYAWEVDAWIGHDLNKIWLKSNGETGKAESGKVETYSKNEILYSHGISTYWDLQSGLRLDQNNESEQQTWLTLGVNGLAPYFFDSGVFAYFNEKDWMIEMTGEYELLLSQKLILVPELELTYFGTDNNSESAKGDTSMEVGIRLRYEFIREFGVYFGFNWERFSGNNSTTFDRTSVIGLRAWL